MGNVAPVVLYLVAALVTLTTMTSMSEKAEGHGLLQALGYGPGDIPGQVPALWAPVQWPRDLSGDDGMACLMS